MGLRCSLEKLEGESGSSRGNVYALNGRSGGG